MHMRLLAKNFSKLGKMMRMIRIFFSASDFKVLIFVFFHFKL